MMTHKPSRTAFRVAVRRAVHQLMDNPRVFDDPLALPIIGPEAASELASDTFQTEQAASQALRAFIAVRSRYAEDELKRAVDNGVKQYVVLGAGLDTFAYRNPHAGLRVFEVDHPSTQDWKRGRLTAAGIAIPPEAIFVPMNFEQQSLGDALASAGFRNHEAAFFACLGVVPYLTASAFATTLAYIASMPPASGVVFDYAVTRSMLSTLEQAAFDDLSNRVASAGEPFQLFFEPQKLDAQLRLLGFRHLENLGAAEINARYFQNRQDSFRITAGLAHLLTARL